MIGIYALLEKTGSSPFLVVSFLFLINIDAASGKIDAKVCRDSFFGEGFYPNHPLLQSQSRRSATLPPSLIHSPYFYLAIPIMPNIMV